MRPQLLRNACTAALISGLTLTGCASFPVLKMTTSPGREPRATQDPIGQSPTDQVAREPRPSFEEIDIPGKLALLRPKPVEDAKLADLETLLGLGTVNVSLPPQPVPQFLDTALGEILKVPYSLGPNIGSRQEVITLRSSPDMSRVQFFTQLQSALRDYGIRLTVRNGVVMALDDTGPNSDPAIIVRSRSSDDTPVESRSVVQFFQLQTLEAGAILPMVQELFPASRSINITSDAASNSLILRGPGRDIQGVVGFLQGLDQPAYAGAKVLKFQPIYWGVDAFAKALEDTLTLEGYKITRSVLATRSIMILTMPNTGQVLVFVNDDKLFDRVRFWASTLDQPSGVTDQITTFVYDVQNSTAADLALMATGAASSSSAPTQTPVGVAGGAPATAQAAVSQSRGVVGGSIAGGGTIGVDPIGNRILFMGTASQFSVFRSLLVQLDRPAPQVMIEVTIAEVDLTDQTQLGLEWFFKQSAMGGSFSGGTEKGLGLAGSGLSIAYARKSLDLRAAFNAFAKNNKVNIISRPQLTAKSGEKARIQVGTDIPIITSQAASNVQSNSSTQVLQTVQYRQTGVILDIKPTVYGDNRIDLDISQEVSKQAEGGSAAIASPSILSRSLSTRISLTDGATHVMGGLIDDNYTKGNQGIPFLKDIPIVGNAFRTDTVSGTKTELIILVTPLILRDSDDMANLASQMTGTINQALKVGRGGSYTLTGVSTGLNLGINLPPSRPPVAGKSRITPPANTKKRPPNASSPSARP